MQPHVSSHIFSLVKPLKPMEKSINQSTPHSQFPTSLWMFFISGSAPNVNSTSTIQRSSLRAANLGRKKTPGAFPSQKATPKASIYDRIFMIFPHELSMLIYFGQL